MFIHTKIKVFILKFQVPTIQRDLEIPNISLQRNLEILRMILSNSEGEAMVMAL